MPGDNDYAADSETESEYEVCDGLFACETCCGYDDMGECAEGCTAIFLPCWEEDAEEEDPCLCSCCGLDIRLVKDFDAMCCGCCTGIATCAGTLTACFTNLFECFTAVFTFIAWMLNFPLWRKWLYGNDVDPKEKGRNFALKRCMGPEMEHCVVIIFAMILSVADTATDAYVIYKWFTVNPNAWEACCLIGVLCACWGTSAWLRTHWIPEGDNPYEDQSCWSKWICSSLPFHFVGLGVAAEGFKSLGDYDGIMDNYRNINPYKWVETLFESGPSALLTIYVISKGSINNNESRDANTVIAEFVSIGISLFSIAAGMAATVTQEIPRGKTTRDIGENGATRMAMAAMLILADLVFRLFLIVMWVNYGNVLGITDTWAKFVVGLSATWVFEMIIVSMNGMVAAWWQVPIQAYTQIFQGGVGFFNRSWPREDKENKGHKRNILTFFIRYCANWAVFLWIYFDLSQREGTYISKIWTDLLIIAAAIEPVFFLMKPPSMTAREVFPFIQVITEMGWKRGNTTFMEERMSTRMSTGPAVQMTKNPAGNRVAYDFKHSPSYGGQSMQSMNLTDDDSDFV